MMPKSNGWLSESWTPVEPPLGDGTITRCESIFVFAFCLRTLRDPSGGWHEPEYGTPDMRPLCVWASKYWLWLICECAYAFATFALKTATHGFK